MHDWPDASSVVILKNIRQAMNANSRLFIRKFIGTHIDACVSQIPSDEYILQAVTDETSVVGMNTALVRIIFPDSAISSY